MYAIFEIAGLSASLTTTFSYPFAKTKRLVGYVNTEQEAKAYIERYSYRHIARKFSVNEYIYSGELVYEKARLLDINTDLEKRIQKVEDNIEDLHAKISIYKDINLIDGLNDCIKHLEKLEKIKESEEKE